MKEYISISTTSSEAKSSRCLMVSIGTHRPTSISMTSTHWLSCFNKLLISTMLLCCISTTTNSNNSNSTKELLSLTNTQLKKQRTLRIQIRSHTVIVINFHTSLIRFTEYSCPRPSNPFWCPISNVDYRRLLVNITSFKVMIIESIALSTVNQTYDLIVG